MASSCSRNGDLAGIHETSPLGEIPFEGFGLEVDSTTLDQSLHKLLVLTATYFVVAPSVVCPTQLRFRYAVLGIAREHNIFAKEVLEDVLAIAIGLRGNLHRVRRVKAASTCTIISPAFQGEGQESGAN